MSTASPPDILDLLASPAGFLDAARAAGLTVYPRSLVFYRPTKRAGNVVGVLAALIDPVYREKGGNYKACFKVLEEVGVGWAEFTAIDAGSTGYRVKRKDDPEEFWAFGEGVRATQEVR